MPRPPEPEFDQIASFPALLRAARRAARGKRRKPKVAAFLASLESQLLRLERELYAGTWRPGRYRSVSIRDPKPRTISVAPFADRVVHHALCAAIQPTLEGRFIHDTYANRVGKGSHRAIERYEHFRNRSRFVLRCDIYRYFAAIDHQILEADLVRRLRSEPILALLRHIIDGSNPQEPVHLHYPGDDLFTPLQRRRGLPIGNLTSQLFGNVYLDRLDHYVTEVLRPRGYVRFVDDFAVFEDSVERLEECRARISEVLARRRLSLHPRKTRIESVKEPAEFLGFVLLADGRRRLPDENVKRFRQRLRALRDRWRSGSVDEIEVSRRIGGWVAHAEHANTWRLRHRLFRGGAFDPAREPGRPASRVLRGGSWNNNARNVRSANRNNNAPDNRNNNVGFRVASTLPARAGTSTDAPGEPRSVQGRP